MCQTLPSGDTACRCRPGFGKRTNLPDAQCESKNPCPRPPATYLPSLSLQSPRCTRLRCSPPRRARRPGLSASTLRQCSGLLRTPSKTRFRSVYDAQSGRPCTIRLCQLSLEPQTLQRWSRDRLRTSPTDPDLYVKPSQSVAVCP